MKSDTGPFSYAFTCSVVASLIYAGGQMLLLLWFSNDLSLAAQNNSELNIFQILPFALSEQYPWDSLLFLQQSPPFPHLLMNLVEALSDTPAERAHWLAIIIIICLSFTCYFLSQILTSCGFKPLWAAGLSILVLAQFDVVVLQYDHLGQTFYEYLAMVSLAALMHFCLKARNDPTKSLQASMLYAGLFTVLLALSRSSFSYVLVVPLFWFLTQKKLRQPVGVLLFLTPILLFQGSWAVKQQAIFGKFRWETSTWGGNSLHTSMLFRGENQNAIDYYLEHTALFPDWFNNLMASASAPLAGWYPDLSMYTPDEINKLDLQINDALGGLNPASNTVAATALYDNYKKLYFFYLASEPQIIPGLTYTSYKLFWVPTRNYVQGQYASLFFIDNDVDLPFSLSRMSGISYPTHSRIHLNTSEVRANFFGTHEAVSERSLPWETWAALSLAYQQLVFIAFHIAPFYILWMAVRRGRTYFHTNEFAVLTLAYMLCGYLAGLSSLVEYGENMRFRLAIEPLLAIILCTLGRRLYREPTEKSLTQAS